MKHHAGAAGRNDKALGLVFGTLRLYERDSGYASDDLEQRPDLPIQVVDHELINVVRRIQIVRPRSDDNCIEIV
ncbi:hypothetical protein Mnod_4028 [Methylobacterium nodulans ORS 2060]|uniref:Uncharacterized protein n=1 Tax=Methylobacterium nodulans (strain LMG 21967 / CNCM I-2342 / ORS 2060) TaxID=460265 RepID=B8ITJ4_METNO|nr:hypothetical protein [Methylobacterium nodulans]ACL58910.1 hypothetical protein Mnod_4028 [Methylobacterium nodulans ORS 2060]